MIDRSWMPYVMPFGKHTGKTLFMIRNIDPQYLQWVVDNTGQSRTRDECEKALEYLREVDPWCLGNTHTDEKGHGYER